MDEEQIRKMIEDTGIYDDSKEDTLRSMISDFYSTKMLSIVIIVWTQSLIYLAGAVFCGIQFFRTDLVAYQIMYAAIFITCIQFLALMKIFAWLMLHKNSIKREMKRLELRIAELTQAVKGD